MLKSHNLNIYGPKLYMSFTPLISSCVRSYFGECWERKAGNKNYGFHHRVAVAFEKLRKPNGVPGKADYWLELVKYPGPIYLRETD